MIKNKTHKSFGQFYRTWKAIKVRCRTHKDYGLRGIAVCPRWQNFQNFHEDMYPSFKLAIKRLPNVSIERIDNDKDYCLENCKWIPMSDQAKNRRVNILVTYKGKTKTLSEWSRNLKINYDALRARIVRKGIGVKESIERPYRNRRQQVQQLSLNGKLIKEWPTIRTAARTLGIQESGIIRAARGEISHSGGFLWKNNLNSKVEFIKQLEK